MIRRDRGIGGRLGRLQTRITALALVIFGVAGMMGGAILVGRLLSAIQEQQGQLAMAVMPAMLFGLHIPMRAAAGASLATVALSAGVGLIGKVVTGQVDWLLAAALVGGAIPGSIIGALVSRRTRVEHLSTVFGVVVGLVAIRIWIGILA